jgi:hypothetical protein
MTVSIEEIKMLASDDGLEIKVINIIRMLAQESNNDALDMVEKVKPILTQEFSTSTYILGCIDEVELKFGVLNDTIKAGIHQRLQDVLFDELHKEFVRIIALIRVCDDQEIYNIVHAEEMVQAAMENPPGFHLFGLAGIDDYVSRALSPVQRTNPILRA